ncbi:hypothetical protein A5686_15485 [Mycobacterium sp. E2479]|nr:hypothetical protein A5686_15485 [Mycobacterium sp. E2479]
MNIDPIEQALTLASLSASLTGMDSYPEFRAAVAGSTKWLSRNVPNRTRVSLNCAQHNDRVTSAAIEAAVIDAMKDVPVAITKGLPEPPRFWPLAIAGAQREKFLYRSSIPYGSAVQQTLDIWRRPDMHIVGAPVLIFVPGGGWMHSGRFLQGYSLMSEMVRRGWICLSVSYRTAPRHRWPNHIRDVLAAVAWAKRNIVDFGGSPNFVAIAGTSAGAHLAVLAGLAPRDRDFTKELPSDDDTAVDAVVSFYGRYSWIDRSTPARDQFIRFVERVIVGQSLRENPALFNDASPVLRVHADAPPFFVLHGDADRVIPVSEARAFVDRLRAASRSLVAYAEMPGAGHGFDMTNRLAAHYAVASSGLFLDAIYELHGRDDAHAV